MAYCLAAPFVNKQKRELPLVRKCFIVTTMNKVSTEENFFGYKYEKVNLAPIIEDKIREDGEKIKNQNVSVSFNKPEEEGVFVNGDKDKLSEVIENLLDNAIKYTPKGGKVEVVLEKNKNSARVSVVDAGMGILEEEAPHVFEKFFRGEQAKNIHKEGSGLGLFIVKNIIERHKGEVGFTANKDKGTTFFFTLPLV